MLRYLWMWGRNLIHPYRWTCYLFLFCIPFLVNILRCLSGVSTPFLFSRIFQCTPWVSRIDHTRMLARRDEIVSPPSFAWNESEILRDGYRFVELVLYPSRKRNTPPLFSACSLFRRDRKERLIHRYIVRLIDEEK